MKRKIETKDEKDKAKEEDDGDTESDSDFDSLNLVANTSNAEKILQDKGKRSRGKGKVVVNKNTNYLEEYLTMGELAGLVPSSLLVNVDFEKFSHENGFEPIDST